MWHYYLNKKNDIQHHRQDFNVSYSLDRILIPKFNNHTSPKTISKNDSNHALAMEIIRNTFFYNQQKLFSNEEIAKAQEENKPDEYYLEEFRKKLSARGASDENIASFMRNYLQAIITMPAKLAGDLCTDRIERIVAASSEATRIHLIINKGNIHLQGETILNFAPTAKQPQPTPLCELNFSISLANEKFHLHSTKLITRCRKDSHIDNNLDYFFLKHTCAKKSDLSFSDRVNKINEIIDSHHWKLGIVTNLFCCHRTMPTTVGAMLKEINATKNNRSATDADYENLYYRLINLAKVAKEQFSLGRSNDTYLFYNLIAALPQKQPTNCSHKP